jgi:hypothetical protein
VVASELLVLGRIMQPLLRTARQRARARIAANLGSPTGLTQAIASVFAASYLDGVDAAVTVFGAQLGVARVSVTNEMGRNLTERMLTAVGVARRRVLQQVEGEVSGALTVAQLQAQLETASEAMVWRGQDDEADVVARLAEVQWKTWVRAFARDENRDHHDHPDILGVTIPVDDYFILPGGDHAGVRVYGPRDWNEVADPGEWMNCGHALDFKQAATAEDLEPTLRTTVGPTRVFATEDEMRERAGLDRRRATAPDGPFRPTR